MSRRVFDLSVLEDETFLAEGVIVHNCRSGVTFAYDGEPGLERTRPLTGALVESLRDHQEREFPTWEQPREYGPIGEPEREPGRPPALPDEAPGAPARPGQPVLPGRPGLPAGRGDEDEEVARVRKAVIERLRR